VSTARDAYAFNPSRAELERHMRRLISTYNEHVRRKKEGKLGEREKDESLIKWDSSLIRYLKSPKAKEASFEGSGQVYEALYRPFVPMHLYLSRTLTAGSAKSPASGPPPRPRTWPSPWPERGVTPLARWLQDE
jgi:predicted helicase